MKNKNLRYICSSCGHVESKWMGRCPECGQWNSFEEEVIVKEVKNKSNDVIDQSLRKLSDVSSSSSIRLSSGFDELDRVLGGGIMLPSSVIVGGEPGIGKSTLMLESLARISEKDSVLYISGEESPVQVKSRAERLDLDCENIYIYSNTNLESVVSQIEKIKPAVVVIDSIQTLFSSEVESIQGTITQIRACALSLSLLAKKLNFCVFFIAHVTKDGNIAGPKIIEHMVDTVLYFESAENGIRLLRTSKNRFGSVDEIGFFSMDSKGLHGIKNPNEIFIMNREEDNLPPGIAFTAAVEGTRTFIIELQALVVPAKSGLQRIYSDKIDISRVSRVAAILERHIGLHLSDKDIYVNIAGGVKVKDVSLELPLALAIYSSAFNRSLSEKTISFGELSLAAEVRNTASSSRMIKTAKDAGFENIICPYENKKDGNLRVKTLKTAIKTAFALR